MRIRQEARELRQNLGERVSGFVERHKPKAPYYSEFTAEINAISTDPASEGRTITSEDGKPRVLLSTHGMNIKDVPSGIANLFVATFQYPGNPFPYYKEHCGYNMTLTSEKDAKGRVTSSQLEIARMGFIPDQLFSYELVEIVARDGKFTIDRSIKEQRLYDEKQPAEHIEITPLVAEVTTPYGERWMWSNGGPNPATDAIRDSLKFVQYATEWSAKFDTEQRARMEARVVTAEPSVV